jgi:hypothetical protein
MKGKDNTSIFVTQCDPEIKVLLSLEEIQQFPESVELVEKSIPDYSWS